MDISGPTKEVLDHGLSRPGPASDVRRCRKGKKRNEEGIWLADERTMGHCSLFSYIAGVFDGALHPGVSAGAYGNMGGERWNARRRGGRQQDSVAERKRD